MLKRSLTTDEILAAEQAAEDRKQSRKAGFNKMLERDAVMHRLSNGVIMLWSVDPKMVKTTAGGTWPNIPEDKFMLVIDGKEHYFDTGEFSQWLRWA
jgi:hypothetical protein